MTFRWAVVIKQLALWHAAEKSCQLARHLQLFARSDYFEKMIGQIFLIVSCLSQMLECDKRQEQSCDTLLAQETQEAGGIAAQRFRNNDQIATATPSGERFL